MPYSKENLQSVREKIAARRASAIATYETRREKLTLEIPSLAEIERNLAMTGSRIMGAALAHELNEASLNEIRKENERLRKMRSVLLTANGYSADYLDIKYTCPLCSDTGYVGIDMCKCMKRELTIAGIKSSGLMHLMESQSFESFNLSYYTGADLIKAQTNLKLLRDFAYGFSTEKSASWLLIGHTGLGKTHLSTATAKVVIERGFDVVYESAQGIISSFEAVRFGGDYESRHDKKYFDCDLLIIDDLGVEVSNQFTLSCVYNIINARINQNKSTIINTNLSQSELRERYADRITSRLFGEFSPLLFTGRDIRGQKIRKS